MDRVAVLIDAGYLFAAGSTLLAGHKLRRGETRLDEVAALAFFDGLARATGLALLRIYWYDGTNAGPSPVHTSLAYRSNVKVRLGIVNSAGEQKGVDSLIVTDLINLSRNRAMADAILLTGDEDIRVGVQQAQELGVRVHLVGIEPAQSNQSNLLRQEVDTTRESRRWRSEPSLPRSRRYRSQCLYPPRLQPQQVSYLLRQQWQRGAVNSGKSRFRLRRRSPRLTLIASLTTSRARFPATSINNFCVRDGQSKAHRWKSMRSENCGDCSSNRVRLARNRRALWKLRVKAPGRLGRDVPDRSSCRARPRDGCWAAMRLRAAVQPSSVVDSSHRQ
jgi:NYN domain